MSIKNLNDTIGNRTLQLAACSEVPKPTVPPRAPISHIKVKVKCSHYRPGVAQRVDRVEV